MATAKAAPSLHVREMNPRIKKKLTEQLDFIYRSTKTFDAGLEDEAIRIATHLRVLFHNTQRSKSLFRLLKLQKTKILSSSRGHKDWKDFLGGKIDLSSSTPSTFYPLLGDQFHEISLKEWWSEEVIFSHNGEEFSRKSIALSISNKDGGAHVDEKLEAYYEILCKGEYALGITGNLQYQEEPPFKQGIAFYPKNGHLCLIRQFAHEVLVSNKHYNWQKINP